MKTRFGIAGFIALICWTSVAALDFAETYYDAGSSGFQLSEEPIGARSTALGAAGAAIGGAGFMAYNPARIALMKTGYLSFEFGRWPQGDLSSGVLEAAWVNDGWFAGVGASSFSVGGIEMRSFDGNGNDSLQSSWQQSFLALAGGVTRDRFTGAISVQAARDKIVQYERYALSIKIGMLYALVPGKLQMGIAGLDLNATSGMFDTKLSWLTQSDYPMNARIGLSWSDTIRGIGYTVAADAVGRFVKADSVSYGFDRMMVPLGIEVWPVRYLAIRLGKRINHPTELFSCGFGLSMAPLNVDASFVVPQFESSAEIKFRIGLTYAVVAPALPAQKKEVTPVAAVPAASPREPAPASSGRVLSSMPQKKSSPRPDTLTEKDSSAAGAPVARDTGAVRPQTSPAGAGSSTIPPGPDTSAPAVVPADSVGVKQFGAPAPPPVMGPSPSRAIETIDDTLIIDKGK